MRIITGKARGLKLTVPKNMDVRPTADRVKESLFNIIGTKIIGARVLDMFAGTGNLGLESWSRGAAAVTFVDESRESLRLVQSNIVGKSRYYAGRYSLFNGASLCVPQLHVAIFTGDTRADFMRYAAVIAMEALQLDKSIIIRHAQKIEIRCNVEDFAAELDGDAITSAPLQIELHPVPINFLA